MDEGAPESHENLIAEAGRVVPQDDIEWEVRDLAGKYSIVREDGQYGLQRFRFGLHAIHRQMAKGFQVQLKMGMIKSPPVIYASIGTLEGALASLARKGAPFGRINSLGDARF